MYRGNCCSCWNAFKLRLQYIQLQAGWQQAGMPNILAVCIVLIMSTCMDSTACQSVPSSTAPFKPGLLSPNPGPDMNAYTNSSSDCRLNEVDILASLGWLHAYNSSGYSLKTSLPPNCSAATWKSLGCLTSLVTLHLTGSLPHLPDEWAASGSFPALKVLRFSSAELSGSLPSSWSQPAAFRNLLILEVKSTQLSAILPLEWGQAGAFERLTQLSIGDSKITGTLPSSWANAGAFPALSRLYLSNLPLTGSLPPSWATPGALASLETLRVCNTGLSGTLPAEWGSAMSFHRLSTLYIEYADIAGTLPASWASEGSFLSLGNLTIVNTNISGTLPAEWGSPSAFKSLTTLDIEYANIAGTLPSSWADEGAFRSLQQLQLEYLAITGSLPQSWTQRSCFPQLNNMTISSTSLSGSLPLHWTGPPALACLNLEFHQLSGTLLSSWPATVKVLDLTGNNFSGMLPAAWSQHGALQRLEGLYLGGNLLSGTLPASWSTVAPNLSSLDLGDNNLTGQVPEGCSQADAFHSLESLALSSNQLVGSLPSSWPAPVLHLDVSYNQFSGSLPGNLSLLARVRQLILSHNKFAGELPAAWAAPNALPLVELLWCTDTLVSGVLPASWGHQHVFQKLLSLALDNSPQLGGKLPDSWALPGAFPALRLLYLDYIPLTGVVPTSWTAHTAFPSMHGLYASHTHLSGSLPAFHNINLRGVTMSNCAFKSDLSELWTSSAPLEIVRFANNNIIGSLPESSMMLSKIIGIDVGGPQNHLQGTVPLTWLQPDHFLSHTSWLNVGNVWHRSTASTPWRQELCLHRDFYSADVIRQDLMHLPSITDGFIDEAVDSSFANAPIGDLQLAYAANLDDTGSTTTVSDAATLAFLLQSDANQLISVMAICANADSKVVLLLLWGAFALCVLLVLCGYTCLSCMSARLSSTGMLSDFVVSKFWLRLCHIAGVIYKTFSGLGGLAFYYYDLISSIVVLVQIWGSWPAGVLISILFVHFAVTGAVIAFHAIHRLFAVRYIVFPNRLRTVVVVLVSLAVSPWAVPFVLLMDTAVFVRQVLLVTDHLLEMLHLHCCQSMSTTTFKIAFESTPKVLGLSWIDLEVYEAMHNAIAAVLQSFPTVVFNSALFALGNKPSHGVFFSNSLFVVAATASFLSVLKSLVLLLYLAYKRQTSAVAYAYHTMVGNTLTTGQDVLASS